MVDGSTLVVISAVFLCHASISRRLHGTSLTAPIVFVGAGCLFGAQGLGWLDVSEVVKLVLRRRSPGTVPAKPAGT